MRTTLPYIGLIVAAVMFFYGIINLITSTVALIFVGMPYGQIHLGVIQSLISGIILVTPGCIVYWKSKMLRELLK